MKSKALINSTDKIKIETKLSETDSIDVASFEKWLVSTINKEVKINEVLVDLGAKMRSGIKLTIFHRVLNKLHADAKNNIK